tara:strand:- start:77 stop:427 length:351 start_codon:yes stop_codon:yes gene_type:complete
MSEKKYKSISEVSKILNLKKHVIRYWDSKFDGLSIRLNSNKQRFFNNENIIKLREIKNALYKNGKHNYSLDLANTIANKKNINLHEEKISVSFSSKNFIYELKLISQNLKRVLKSL